MQEFFTTLNQTPFLLYSSFLVLGLLVGSFLNVVIHRLPKMLEQEWKLQASEFLELEPPKLENLTLSTPNSTCPKCGHAIRAWENIPIISYLFLRGKCSGCKTGISIRYPLVELTSGLMCLAIAIAFGASYAGLALLLFTWALIALTMIDADTQLLPDNITLPLMWLGLIVNYFELITSFESAFFGAVFGYLVLWSIYWLFKLLTGKEGMGYGDFKLLAALGAWLGWEMLPIIVLLSSVVGALYGLGAMLIQGRDKNKPMPFGPYLAVAGWVALVWGNEIKRVWLG
ncbi:methyltransferase [Oleiphilus sp. HI0071]|jgi:leader peptidase (prepilin peptidase)/N-methyltransferase|uniref:prepilin peptidase n=1 Tax=unclassified Oleiphilus TaxID=2631174 RepID=UPI0007C29CDC|nr:MULTISPECIES: A24 family peptidase [unclassified Oleiphilus]KZY70947.1 methyltransferase [Oleiphilus sp. HI0065]KZY82450.1 methyltransferase [Oleiphilus sp. HI0071]KZZ03805.1 methyltransferase [Oleiphilus sp. HI0073]KZZ40586.1 methyltransferase [Oleiphilus sp. HI0118]KZZ51336.1 methyltransferase [Oleiphilus sp. HI0122]KZZ78744.1 methyltransferase [Oleiphilus sp. HI0133]